MLPTHTRMFTALLLLVAAAPAAAGEPFASLRATVAVVHNVHADGFDDYWDPRTGGSFELQTPFYLGETGIGFNASKNSSLAEGVPGFRSIYLYLDWGLDVALPADLSWNNGVNAGLYFMDFAEEPFSHVEETESELGLGARTRLRYPSSAQWSVVVHGEYRVIYTANRIEHVLVSIGVSRSFDSPPWLIRFLQ